MIVSAKELDDPSGLRRILPSADLVWDVDERGGFGWGAEVVDEAPRQVVAPVPDAKGVSRGRREADGRVRSRDGREGVDEVDEGRRGESDDLLVEMS